MRTVSCRSVWSRTKRQNPLPPFRLQRVLRELRELPKRARGTSRAKNSRQGHGRPCRREVAGTGTEQLRFHSGKQVVTTSCDVECDAISADRIELLARTVILVAGMNLPEADRATVMSRLLAAVGKEAQRAGRDLDRAETLALDFWVDRVVCVCILL